MFAQICPAPTHTEPLKSGAVEATLPVWRRCLYTAIGIFFVIFGFIGIFLPGIPTTGPLLLASFLLAKGNPRLEKLLIRNRLFRRYLKFLDGSSEMPMKARLWAAGWMWLAICASSGWMLVSSPALLPAVVACLAAGVVGTVVIFRFRRSNPASHETTVPHNKQVAQVAWLNSEVEAKPYAHSAPSRQFERDERTIDNEGIETEQAWDTASRHSRSRRTLQAAVSAY